MNRQQRIARLCRKVEALPSGSALPAEDLAELLDLFGLRAEDYPHAHVESTLAGRNGVVLTDANGRVGPVGHVTGALRVRGLASDWLPPGPVRRPAPPIPSCERHTWDEAHRLVLAVRRLGGREPVTRGQLSRLAGISSVVFERAADEAVRRGLAVRVEVPLGRTGKSVPGIRLTSAAA